MSQDADQAEGPEWPCGHLVIALVVALLFQMLYLPCLCQIGVAKGEVALIFDGLMVVRIVAAKLLHERGKGWIFYAALTYTSPLWIDLASRITVGPH